MMSRMALVMATPGTRSMMTPMMAMEGFVTSPARAQRRQATAAAAPPTMLVKKSEIRRQARARVMRDRTAPMTAAARASFQRPPKRRVKKPVPIAAARILTDSNPGQVSSSLARELGRIDGYVDQALYYARSATLDRDYVIREVRLRDIVTDAVKGHARSLIDGGVRVEVQGLDVTVFADAKWMSFVLGQLVENAVKYRGAAPCLAFSAQVRGRGTADECVELAVEDNGIGIPAEDLPRVFDKGFVGRNGRLEGQTKSTGLGLYLVKRLCDKMGVGVRMESEQGRFTRATLTFPPHLTQVV